MAEMEQDEKTTDYNEFNRQLMEEFRANGGKVSGMFAGAPLLLLTTTGARSGQPRVVPLVYTTDNGRVVVIASKGGSPTHPDWFHNLRADPEVTVELGTETFRARATIATGAERQRLFDQMPNFAEYQRNTARQLPVIVLERTG